MINIFTFPLLGSTLVGFRRGGGVSPSGCRMIPAGIREKAAGIILGAAQIIALIFNSCCFEAAAGNIKSSRGRWRKLSSALRFIRTWIFNKLSRFLRLRQSLSFRRRREDGVSGSTAILLQSAPSVCAPGFPPFCAFYHRSNKSHFNAGISPVRMLIRSVHP